MYNRQIPENDGQCDGDCDHDFRFGMNENQESYKSCKNRARNNRLFTADQVNIYFLILKQEIIATIESQLISLLI